MNFLVHKVLTQATAAFSREIQEIPGSGRLSQAEFARLAIVHCGNLLKDPKSKVFGIHTTALLANDLLAFVETIAPAWMKRPFGSGEDTSTAHRELEEKYTKLLGEDNLVGSAGEFGLLFALLANRPDA